jgi:hypothetical protein
LENKKQYLNEITTVIETLACTNNPGPTAVEAAKHIDKHFHLIYRTLDLPKVEIGPSGIGRLSHITEGASKGDTKVMRELAYEYLAMADFVDAKRNKEQDMKLRTDRWNAYKILYPYQNMWTLGTFNYEDLDPLPKRAIDEIVRLRSQLDK